MELKERVTSARTVSNRQLNSRSGGDARVPEMKLKRNTFKSKARQVWMANVIARQRTIVSSKQIPDDNERKLVNDTGNLTDSISTPSIKRKGTPDIFPMSSEMKRTLLLLGNLDLLPEEERLQQRALSDATEKKISARNKFRQKTQQKIINPQRFVQGIKSCTLKKDSVVKEKENASKNNEHVAATADGIINAENDNSEKAFDQEKRSDESMIEIEEKHVNNNIIGDENLEQTHKPLKSRTLSGPRKKNTNGSLLWKTSYQNYQALHTLDNLSTKTNLANNLNFKLKRSRTKIHHSAGTWQHGTQWPLRVHEYPKRRAVSLNFDRTFITDTREQTSDKDLSPRDKRTIEEITTDIQLRCSKWFEFRQKVLKQKGHR